MHFFFIDLYIGLDHLAPVIYSLNKKEHKTEIYSLNPVHDYRKDPLIKFLTHNNKNFYKGFLFLGIINTFYLFVLKIILKFPKFLLIKLNRLWTYLYRKKIFFSEKALFNFLNNKKIISITIDESLNINKIKIIAIVCNKLKIKLVVISTGLYTIKNKKITFIKEFDKIDFFLSSNNLCNFDNTKNSSKYKVLGCPRYSFEWIEELNKIFKKKLEKRKKLNIGYFVRSTAYNYKDHLSLIKKIKNFSFIDIKIRNKPREIVPSKISDFSSDELNSTELINWADIIISTPSSILVESVQKNKTTICLEYLFSEPDDKVNHFSEFYEIFCLANSDKDVIYFIENYDYLNKKNIKPDKKNEFFNLFIHTSQNNDDLLEKYANFYHEI